jgi:hypothetical protein
LENPGPSTTKSGIRKRIPVGTYKLVWHHGTRFKGVPKVYNENVSQNRAILIHKGTKPSHTDGCLLLGKTMGSNSIGNSSEAINEMYAFLKKVDIQNVSLVITEQLGAPIATSRDIQMVQNAPDTQAPSQSGEPSPVSALTSNPNRQMPPVQPMSNSNGAPANASALDKMTQQTRQQQIVDNTRVQSQQAASAAQRLQDSRGVVELLSKQLSCLQSIDRNIQMLVKNPGAIQERPITPEAPKPAEAPKPTTNIPELLKSRQVDPIDLSTV